LFRSLEGTFLAALGETAILARDDHFLGPKETADDARVSQHLVCGRKKVYRVGVGILLDSVVRFERPAGVFVQLLEIDSQLVGIHNLTSSLSMQNCG
jgi:hypothetical protein